MKFNLHDLRTFASVPSYGYDVVALLGLVIVYDTDWREVQDGCFYVTENQRPVAGMSWEMHDRLNHEHGRDLRSRLTTSRTVVQVVRCAHEPGHWWYRLPSGFMDGPLADWGVGHTIVGKVLGLYLPN